MPLAIYCMLFKNIPLRSKEIFYTSRFNEVSKSSFGEFFSFSLSYLFIKYIKGRIKIKTIKLNFLGINFS